MVSDVTYSSLSDNLEYASYWRGYLVWLWPDGLWRYEDGVAVDDDPDRICPRCGRPPTRQGYDACLGHIPGCVSACCGHGANEPFFLFDEGR